MSSKIEWTEKTWNPVTGCTKVSPGCKNCYAERMARRLAGRCGYPEAPNHFDVTLHHERLEQPLKWRKSRKIFVCSMSDLFHEGVEVLDSTFTREVFAMMALCPQHTFQVLTKRPHVARLTLTDEFAENVQWAVDGIVSENEAWHIPDFEWPLPNVWLGVSVENQKAADERIPLLLQMPAAVRFVSLEPILSPVYIHPYLPFNIYGHPELSYRGLDWVIVGAESGPNRRPFDVAWALATYQQCQAAGIPFFGKQASGPRPSVPLVLPGIGEVKEWPA